MYSKEKNKERMLEALERCLGVVTPACKEIGLTRKVFYDYYHSDPDFKAKVDDIQDITFDFVENQLFKAIKNGSERSIMFYMKYKGRRRGYSDSVDVNVTNDKIKFDFGNLNQSDLDTDNPNSGE